jgi:hypothetical protein
MIISNILKERVNTQLFIIRVWSMYVTKTATEFFVINRPSQFYSFFYLRYKISQSDSTVSKSQNYNYADSVL